MTNKKNVRGIELGTALQAHLEAIRLLGADGVEQRLKEIREATFQRMAEHKNNSLTWEQICAIVPELDECHGHCDGVTCTTRCKTTPA